MDFKNSQTKINLMRAFAGECQARNRYTFAAEKAAGKNLYVIEAIFKFTANQELAHAKVFYDMLKNFSGEKITFDGSYPVCIEDDVLKLLRCSEHNELEEFDPVYPDFATIANSEGFTDIGEKFKTIAMIEKTHSQRFKEFADLMEANQLFAAEVEQEWICLNCGHVLKSTEAPKVCPVCSHDQGYFIRVVLAPYSTKQGGIK